MPDEFVDFDPLTDGMKETLGDALNDRLEALMLASNLGLRYRYDINEGNWVDDGNYKINDLVWHTSKYWHALAANINSEPDPGNDDWRAFGGDGMGGTSLPDGGTTGQVLTKLSGTDGDANWTTIVTSATRIRRGTGAPSNSLGANGDFYINTTTGTGSGDLYEKATGTYSVVGNVRGPSGAPGTPGTAGINGSAFTEGAGVPDNANGANGDLYVNSETGSGKGDVYKKVAGDWGDPVFNIEGPAGTDGINYDINVHIYGAPPEGISIQRIKAVRAFTLPANLDGSQFDFQDHATADAEFQIIKNGSIVGTVTADAGANTATIDFASDVSWAIGDLLTIATPNPQDATLQGVTMTLKAELI